MAHSALLPIPGVHSQSYARARSSQASLLSTPLRRPVTLVNASSSSNGTAEDVVIVGGGIAGLATALALHRLGWKSTVLEQSDVLRVTGTALGMWTNGWKALEALGVADGLRERFLNLSGFEFYTTDGTCLTSLPFPEGKVELRAVDRRILLERLAGSLPPNTIQYGSRVVKLKKVRTGCTQVELGNGSVLQTKILVGCDGIGSVVAKELGLGEAHYAGYIGVRGMAYYPDGHSFKSVLRQTVGEGVRMGLLPLDSNRIYYFLCFNHPPGKKVSDPKLIKEEALKYVDGWPKDNVDVIKRSSLESLSRANISDRWMWPFGGPQMYGNGVIVAGDALHPVTPNLAQGGCSALEDGVILGRHLSGALRTISHGDGTSDMENMDWALKLYIEERKKRMFPVAVQAYAIGAMLQIEQKVLCSLRNALIPKFLTAEMFIDHSLFDCGKLA